MASEETLRVNYVEISPPKHESNKVDRKEDVEVLVLAPFNRVPKIVFGNIKVHKVCQRKIIIRNPSNRTQVVELVDLPPKERYLDFNFTQAKLLPKEEILLEITWSPKEVGSWKETIPVRTSSIFRTEISVICSSVSPLPLKNRKKLTSTRSPLRLTVNAKKLVPSKFSKPQPRRPSVGSSTVQRSIRLPAGNGMSPCRRQTFLVNSEDKENSPVAIQNKPAQKQDMSFTSRFENFVLSPAVPFSERQNFHHSVLDGFVLSPVTLPKSSNFSNFNEDAVDGDASNYKLAGNSLQSEKVDFKISPSIRRTTFAVSTCPSKCEAPLLLSDAGTSVGDDDCEVFEDSLDEAAQIPQLQPVPEHAAPSILINGFEFSDCIASAPTSGSDMFMDSTIKFDLPSPSEDARRSSTGIKAIEKRINVSSPHVCKDLFPHGESHDVSGIHVMKSSPNSDRASSETFYLNDRLSVEAISHDRLSTSTYVKDRLSTGTYVKEQVSRGSSSSNEELCEKSDSSVNLNSNGSFKLAAYSPELQPARLRAALHSIAEENAVGMSRKLKPIATAHSAPLKPTSFTVNISTPASSQCGKVSNKGKIGTQLLTSNVPSTNLAKPARKVVKVTSPLKNLNLPPIKHEVHDSSKVPATPSVGAEKVKTASKKTQKPRASKSPLIPQSSLNLTKVPRISQKVAKRQQEKSEFLYNTDDIFYSLKNVNLFTVSTDKDPFLNNTIYLDAEWMDRQEKDMIKWLNALLTPPEELVANSDLPAIDVADLWQKTCRQKDVDPAPSREMMSSDMYGKQHRLASLRKAAVTFLRSSQVSDVLQKVSVHVDKKLLAVREDRDLHVDVGLQYLVLELLLCFNPLWLRIGLEVVFGRTVPLKSNSDVPGLATFIVRNLLHDDYIVKQFSHPTVPHLKLPDFQDAMKKFTLKKFLFLVYFLDRAKTEKLIGHDPCLFLRNAKFKQTKDLIVAFARELLAGVGDINRQLAVLGCRLSVKQTYIDEYEYAVKSLLELRDGVRLTRVMEVILNTTGLTSKLRVPAISKLQKIHNVDVALQALRGAGYSICGDITAKHVVEGHREKTMSLLWQIIYKFQAPRFTQAATVVQRWWRRLQFPREIERRIRRKRMKRREAATVTLQAVWRGLTTRRRVAVLRAEREGAALVLQKHWRRHAAEKKLARARWAVSRITAWYRGRVLSRRLREDFLHKRASAVKIQAFLRGFLFRKRFAQLRKTAAALRIQTWFRRRVLARRLEAAIPLARSWEAKRRERVAAGFVILTRWKTLLSMKRDRARYQALRGAALLLQRRYRGRLARDRYLRERSAVVAIQRRWRAVRAMRCQREHFLSMHSAAITIQRFVRGHIHRKSFITIRSAAIVFQQRYRARLAMKYDRVDFLLKRRAARLIQAHVRTWLQLKRECRLYRSLHGVAIAVQRRFRVRIAHMMNHECAAVTLQRHFRSRAAMRRQRADYLAVRSAILVVQARFRAVLVARPIRQDFLALRSAAISVQRRFRGLLETREQRALFTRKRSGAVTLQRWWRTLRVMRQDRSHFTAQREAAVVIQRRWRAYRLGEEVRGEAVRLRQAAVVLQRTWRARRERIAFLRLRTEVRLVQARWRGKCLMRMQMAAFSATRDAVVVIQRRWRATLLARRQRAEFEALRSAVIVVQSRWRARRERRAFALLKRTVVFVQRLWRYRLEAKRSHAERCRLRAAVVLVQRRWRARTLGRLERSSYCRIRSAAIAVQRRWRALLAMRAQHNLFMLWKNSAVVLQRFWRARRLMLRTKAEFERTRWAVVTVQSRWRAQISMRHQRDEFRRQKEAVAILQRACRRCLLCRRENALRAEQHRSATIIQKCVRGYLARRYFKRCLQLAQLSKLKQIRAAKVIQRAWRLNRFSKQERKNAAVTIQKIWRGYCARKAEQEIVLELNNRSHGRKESNRTAAQLIEHCALILTTASTVGSVIDELSTLDLLCHYSPYFCDKVAGKNLVLHIYNHLSNLNRSVAHLEIAYYGTHTLLLLCKYEGTISAVWQGGESCCLYLHLMKIWLSSDCNVFLNCATILWHFAHNQRWAEAILEEPTLKRTVTFCAQKLKSRGFKVSSSLLPSLKPNWGSLNKTGRPQAFTDAVFGLRALCTILKLDVVI